MILYATLWVHRVTILAFIFGIVLGGLFTLRPLSEVGQHGDLVQSGQTPQVDSPARTTLMDEAPITLEAERPAVGHVPTEPSPSEVVRAAPVSRSYSREEIVLIIRNAAHEYGVDPERALVVAWCESSYDPYAVNAVSGATGLWQWLLPTWDANARRVFGRDVGDLRTDPLRSSIVAMSKVAREGWGAWKASEGCWQAR